MWSFAFPPRKHPGFSCYQMIETTSRFQACHTHRLSPAEGCHVSSRTAPSAAVTRLKGPTRGHPSNPHAVYRCLHSGPLWPAVNLKIHSLTWCVMWGCSKWIICVLCVCYKGREKYWYLFSPHPSVFWLSFPLVPVGGGLGAAAVFLTGWLGDLAEATSHWQLQNPGIQSSFQSFFHIIV